MIPDNSKKQDEVTEVKSTSNLIPLNTDTNPYSQNFYSYQSHSIPEVNTTQNSNNGASIVPMPISESPTIFYPEPQIKKKHIVFATIFTSCLFLSFVSLSFVLLYMIANRNINLNLSQDNSASNANITPLQDSATTGNFSDEKCNEKENVLTSSIALASYDRESYFTSTIDPKTNKGSIPAGQSLYIDFISWDNSDKDLLSYKGRALVCIKDQNKVVTVEFNTSTSNLLKPVRYKDPQHSIKNILVQAIYVIPNGADPKPQWKGKITSNLLNIQKAQNRIFNNESQIDFNIYPEPVLFQDIKVDFLTQVAKGIISSDKGQNNNALKPKDEVTKNIYTDSNMKKYPNFFNLDSQGQMIKEYDQITTLVFFEVGNSSKSVLSSKKYESGFAFTAPAMTNGNYFGIIGVDLKEDISKDSASYHEFMHTLGLPDEYKYSDGKAQRIPTHLYNNLSQSLPTLMENPYLANTDKTYIDDQERVMMGIKTK